jgi:hypothetical protein
MKTKGSIAKKNEDKLKAFLKKQNELNVKSNSKKAGNASPKPPTS